MLQINWIPASYMHPNNDATRRKNFNEISNFEFGISMKFDVSRKSKTSTNLDISKQHVTVSKNIVISHQCFHIDRRIQILFQFS